MVLFKFRTTEMRPIFCVRHEVELQFEKEFQARLVITKLLKQWRIKRMNYCSCLSPLEDQQTANKRNQARSQWQLRTYKRTHDLSSTNIP